MPRTAVVADAGLVFVDGTVSAVADDGRVQVYPRRAASLILGEVRVTRGAPVPVDVIAESPADRMAEAACTEDAGAMPAALEEIARDGAGRLDGTVEPGTLDSITDRSLVAELEVEAARLRQWALRLSKLRARVYADHTVQGTPAQPGIGPEQIGGAD